MVVRETEIAPIWLFKVAMTVRILLIAQAGDVREKCRRALADLGAEVVCTEAFKLLDERSSQLEYNGVVVDLQTKIRALKEDRENVYRLLGQFPIAQVLLDQKTGDIRAHFASHLPGVTLGKFVKNECAQFAPRKFRLHIRKRIHYNVILGKTERFEEDLSERSVTIDVSIGGCFVYSVREWKMDMDAWLTIKELKDPTPIRGVVRRAVAWGERKQIPGVGILFVDISREQVRQIGRELGEAI